MKVGDRVQTLKPIPGNTTPQPHVVGEITEIELVEGREFLTVFADKGGIWYFTAEDVEISERVARD